MGFSKVLALEAAGLGWLRRFITGMIRGPVEGTPVGCTFAEWARCCPMGHHLPPLAPIGPATRPFGNSATHRGPPYQLCEFRA